MPARASTRLYLGAETGSYGGVVGYALTAVVIGLALIAFSQSFPIS